MSENKIDLGGAGGQAPQQADLQGVGGQTPYIMIETQYRERKLVSLSDIKLDMVDYIIVMLLDEPKKDEEILWRIRELISAEDVKELADVFNKFKHLKAILNDRWLWYGFDNDEYGVCVLVNEKAEKTNDVCEEYYKIISKN